MKSDIYKILLLFITWKLLLVFVLFFALAYVPLGYKDRFLGGGPLYYQTAPQLYSWANFDGEHYLSLAINGYKPLEQAFFPFYPMLISFFAKPFSYDLVSHLVNSTIVGLLISGICFFLSLLTLYKLIILDYSRKIAFLTIIILLVFPTSFYFSSLYNESLFLLLILLSFYNARKKRWFLSGFFGILASTTRLFGVFLLPSLIFEAFQQKEKLTKFFWILFIPIGLLLYMLYQHISFGDAFAFINLQKLVGEQRQSGFTLLPQVYFRYLKMILIVDPKNPIYQTVVLELFCGVLFFILPIVGFLKKARPSYLIFAFLSFFITTVQGSLSSVPRYVLVFFPSFLIIALILSRINSKIRILLIILSAIFLCIEASLFFRGYWIA